MCRSDLRTEKCDGAKKEARTKFLDVRKAYDTVWREGLWKKMRGDGIAEKLVKWCELFYKRVEAAVVTGHGMTQWFEVEGGLRQGSVLSPLLYSIFMMDLANELEDSGDGVRVEEAYCGMLMFADDTVDHCELPGIYFLCRKLDI